jgi:N-acetyl-gamma-glutamyl-phosphate reductase
MQMLSVGVVGASGYSGMELVRLLARHPQVSLAFATSDRWVGQTLSARLGIGGEAGSSAFVGNEAALAAAAKVDVVLLATPAETSLELGPKLLAAGARVIDLAGSFRLRDASQYPRFYNFTHGAPALLADAVYGLPELFRESIPRARLVANPGCYPTAAALSVAPLFRAGLVEADTLVINAASGISGAGRKATEDYGFMEVDGDFRAYKVLKHQHLPEIEQTLGRVADQAVSLVFTPHLLPVKRGILSTAVATLKPGVTAASVSSAFADAYGKEPLVKLLASPEAVRLAEVVNTPRCHLGVAVEGRRVVAISAIDNLLKGAASQAVQNMNLMLGHEETVGLV